MSNNLNFNTLNESALIEIVKQDGLMLQHINADRLTKELVLEALKNNIESMHHIGDFNDDKEVMMYVIGKVSIYNKYGEPVLVLGKTIKNDRDIVIAMVKIDKTTSSFRYCAYRNDREIAMLAVSKHPYSISYVDKSLYRNGDNTGDDDYTIALEACDWNINAVERLELYLNCKPFLVELLKQSPYAITMHNYIGESQLSALTIEDDYDLVSGIIHDHPELIKYFPDIFKNNNFLIIKALENDGLVLKYCSDAQKDNIDLVKVAVYNNCKSFQYVSDRLKNNKDFVKLTLDECIGENIEFVLDRMSNRLKKDSEFLKTLLRESITTASKKLTISYD